MSRSNVPCGRSMRSFTMFHPVYFYRNPISSPVEAQGIVAKPWNCRIGSTSGWFTQR
jgi:hypothetical protein